jgi:hypothetical protein
MWTGFILLRIGAGGGLREHYIGHSDSINMGNLLNK